MLSVVKGMDKAMDTMNLERVGPFLNDINYILTELETFRYHLSWTSSRLSSPISTYRLATWRIQCPLQSPRLLHRIRLICCCSKLRKRQILNSNKVWLRTRSLGNFPNLRKRNQRSGTKINSWRIVCVHYVRQHPESTTSLALFLHREL